MSLTRACDVCGAVTWTRGRDEILPPPEVKHIRVDRYQLKRYVPDPNGRTSQTMHYVSAGSIDLCDKCWAKYAEHRMQPNKKPKRMRVIA